MLSEIVLIVFFFILLIYSIIIHEVSHGFVALWLGDPTAKYAGRLNLNPVKHVDPTGSILVPLIMYYAFNFAFGWAKPVPYNPYNLRDQKWGPALVALGGPVSNILVAVLFAIIAKFIGITSALKIDIVGHFINLGDYEKVMDWSSLAVLIQSSFGAIFFAICSMIIFWNVVLAFFNLLPIPPLDGSKILYSVLNLRIETVAIMEQFGFVLLLAIMLLFGGFLGSFLYFFLDLFLRLTI